MFTTYSITRVKVDGRPTDIPYQPACTELLPHRDVLPSVLSWQANSRSYLQVLAVLCSEATWKRILATGTEEGNHV